MSIKNFKLTIQYDGTKYSGWQIQKDQKTVQGILKQCVEKITYHDEKTCLEPFWMHLGFLLRLIVNDQNHQD